MHIYISIKKNEKVNSCVSYYNILHIVSESFLFLEMSSSNSVSTEAFVEAPVSRKWEPKYRVIIHVGERGNDLSNELNVLASACCRTVFMVKPEEYSYGIDKCLINLECTGQMKSYWGLRRSTVQPKVFHISDTEICTRKNCTCYQYHVPAVLTLCDTINSLIDNNAKKE